MPVPETSDTELVQIRKLAENLAAARRESLTTAHLLAAIAARSGPAAMLLHERKLDVEVLSKLARASSEAERDPIGLAWHNATDFTRSCGAREPAAIHLLVALLKDRDSAAFKALEQSGVDTKRLRGAAVQIAGGFLSPRRTVPRASHIEAHPEASQAATAREARRLPAKESAGVVVSLFPPPKPVQRVARAPAAEPRPAPPAQQPTAAPAQPPAATPAQQPIAAPAQPPAAPPAKRPIAAPPPAVAHHHEPARQGSQENKRRPAREAQQQPLPVAVPESRFELDPKAFPTLHALGTNLTLAAARGELDPVVGREVETEQVLDVLAKRRANNPCLLGRSGVGKTSIARGLALRIASAREVRTLDDRVIVELPIAQLLAGTGVRGALAERIGAICKEVRSAEGRVVLFIDDIEQLFAGDASGEAVSELKASLARGELPLVATSTAEDYRRTIDADPSLSHCFTAIEIEEPDAEHAVKMIVAMSPVLEKHHGLRIEQGAIDACVAWSVRYLPGRALPEKAFSVLDLAGARSRRRTRASVGAELVAEVIGEMASMPPERLLETDRDRMLALEKLLARRVVGHDAALSRIATILRRNAAGFRGQRPVGSFLLLGPTGVGKTETAKAIAEALFQNAEAMTRLDLSEFSEAHAVARIVGAPPGYVGHEAGGQLTEAVRRRPYQVLLLDEFEKAHRDVLQSFLQVFDEGRMTDGRGRTVDFTNTVIVMTSNLGGSEARQVSETRSIGFSRGDSGKSKLVEDAVVGAARAALPPELYNRIDEVLYFEALTRENVKEVARRLLLALANTLLEVRGIGLDVGDDGIEALLDQGGFDASLGARPMKRAIARLVEAPIAEMVLRDEAKPGDKVRIRAGRDRSVLHDVEPHPRRRTHPRG